MTLAKQSVDHSQSNKAARGISPNLHSSFNHIHLKIRIVVSASQKNNRDNIDIFLMLRSSEKSSSSYSDLRRTLPLFLWVLFLLETVGKSTGSY